MNRVLVVGGAGYIGGAVIDTLNQYNSDLHITIYDSLLYERQFLKNAPFIYGDIRDQDKLEAAIKDHDIIVWLAAIVGDPACNLDPDLAHEINAESVNFLAKVAGDKKIIFMSTCSVYGQNDQPLLTEDAKPNPLSVYASTKLLAEEYLKHSNAIIFRLGTVYGLGDRFARPRFDLVVNIMAANMAREGKLTVYGGEQSRPLIHVKDIAKAVCEAIHRPHVKGTFNLTNHNVTIGELAKIVKGVVGGSIEVTPRDFNDERSYTVDTSKFHSVFDTQFSYSLEAAIEEIADVVRKRRIKDHNHPVFKNVTSLREQL